MMGLTPKMNRALGVIEGNIRTRGVAPTYQQLSAALGLRSRSGAHRIVCSLEERGLIRRIPNKHQAIEIVEASAVPLAPDVRRALREYAKSQGQKPETIIAEAVRAYLGLAQ